MVGICSFGGYVPRYRLDRGKIFAAIGWVNSGNLANARGEKAVANVDEDSITMAVAAGRDTLRGIDRSQVDGVYFASSTLPYKERLNAGIITGALGLDDQVRAADFTGGLKAGTTALLSALEGVESKRVKTLLVAAADCRMGRPGSAQEMIFGDAAAALLVGRENVIAEFKEGYSLTYDFVDHYRGANARFDTQWEDRWIRDLGIDRFIPEAVKGILQKTGLKITDFAKVVYPCHYAAERKKLNKLLGIGPDAEQGNLQMEVGETGVPHALVMLVRALEDARAGDKILVVSYGSGCDALYFEVTGRIEEMRGDRGISRSIQNKAPLDHYTKFLVWRNILPADLGKRSEEDHWSRFSAQWRIRRMVLGLYGGKCKRCGTAQIPAQDICVNPQCGAVGTQEPYCFADKTGHVVSYTGDNLASSQDPPAIYGQVEFEGGGKYMFDFTDCRLEELSPGMAVAMSFRRKYYDEKRDVSGYFWKAVPVKEVK